MKSEAYVVVAMPQNILYWPRVAVAEAQNNCELRGVQQRRVPAPSKSTLS